MVSIKLFAGTDVGLRENNEDNFIVCPDLTKNEWMVPASQQESIQLSQRGCLFVVADGMGGMNAGEVASDIAIKTVQQMFAPSALPASIIEKPDSVKAYLKKVITEADLQVKNRSKADSSAEGMGSTIVIAWLIENNLYVGWLGDSRAYSYSPDRGIERLSKDHSYVQQLVDAKMLTEEEAMNHPESNVVIRSLGDTSQKPKPDVITHSVVKDEIILLCSDGLCGVCTDAEIADVIRQQSYDLQKCKENLTNIALEAGGSDNITIALLQVVTVDSYKGSTSSKHQKTKLLLTLIAAVCLAFVALLIWRCPDNSKDGNIENASIKIDSDTLKSDATTLVAEDKDEHASDDNVTLPDEKVVISFKIAHNGPLESGNEYGFSVSISPDIIGKGGYTITSSDPSAVSVNETKGVVTVSNDIQETKKCTFTISPKLKPSSAKKFEVNLKANDVSDEITHSPEDNVPRITN